MGSVKCLRVLVLTSNPLVYIHGPTFSNTLPVLLVAALINWFEAVMTNTSVAVTVTTHLISGPAFSPELNSEEFVIILLGLFRTSADKTGTKV